MTIAIRGAIDEGTLSITATAQTLEDLGVDVDLLKRADLFHITNNSETDLMYFYGGQTPTDTTGHILAASGSTIISGMTSIRAFRVRTTAGSVTVSYTLSKV